MRDDCRCETQQQPASVQHTVSVFLHARARPYALPSAAAVFQPPLQCLVFYLLNQLCLLLAVFCLLPPLVWLLRCGVVCCVAAGEGKCAYVPYLTEVVESCTGTATN
eukprot:COSAG06_NODE_14986_length_1108_cov_19.817641_4_plen_106_part_01